MAEVFEVEDSDFGCGAGHHGNLFSIGDKSPNHSSRTN
jgi:hypothetical protein